MQGYSFYSILKISLLPEITKIFIRKFIWDKMVKPVWCLQPDSVIVFPIQRWRSQVLQLAENIVIRYRQSVVLQPGQTNLHWSFG